MSTLEERKALYEQKLIAENEHKQYKSALARQKELEFDENFMSLITGIAAACKLANTDMPPKALACKNGIDAVWIEKRKRVDEEDLNLDYSSVGSKPYSYTSVREELESL